MKNQTGKTQNVRKKVFSNLNGLVAILMLGVLAVLFVWRSSAMQSASFEKLPDFEVATIKPNKSADEGGAYISLALPRGRIRITKFSLRMLMGQAFDLPSLSDAFDSIFGIPSWGDSERFDIEAVAKGDPGIPEKRMMLQSLLADRFKLAVHHESRQRPVYVLVTSKPGKHGPQLRPATEKTTCEEFSAGRTGFNSGSSSSNSPSSAAMSALQQFPCGRVVGGLLSSEPNLLWSDGRRVTLEMIAASLGGMELFDRPVLDRTKDSGTFDFTVQWSSQAQNVSSNLLKDASRLALIGALKDQLGLKLEATKAAVPILVVDYVERPSAN